jgi:hypothetical protein
MPYLSQLHGIEPPARDPAIGITGSTPRDARVAAFPSGKCAPAADRRSSAQRCRLGIAHVGRQLPEVHRSCENGHSGALDPLRSRRWVAVLAGLAYGLVATFNSNIGLRGRRQIMARQKPLDPAIAEEWLAAWNESDIFFRYRRSPPSVSDHRSSLPCRRHPGGGPPAPQPSISTREART